MACIFVIHCDIAFLICAYIVAFDWQADILLLLVFVREKQINALRALHSKTFMSLNPSQSPDSFYSRQSKNVLKRGRVSMKLLKR